MIKLELRDYSSGDIPRVWDWVPRSASEVYFQLTIEVGGVGFEGGNLFQLVVATTEGIAQFKTEHPDVDPCPHGTIVLEAYSWQGVIDRIDSELKTCASNSWHDSIKCLGKAFSW